MYIIYITTLDIFVVKEDVIAGFSWKEYDLETVFDFILIFFFK